MADDAVTKMASPWTGEPWQVKQQGAEAMIERLQAPINAAASLTTENINVQMAGDDVLVEQLSTIVNSEGRHVTMICHIFSVADG
ncbi:MAG TPA: nuclear transport factor 2 family protein, partial [Nocardioides sp.]|nr:nuclear transport factor 2 family protein [Nocardioides sp.]